MLVARRSTLPGLRAGLQDLRSICSHLEILPETEAAEAINRELSSHTSTGLAPLRTWPSPPPAKTARARPVGDPFYWRRLWLTPWVAAATQDLLKQNGYDLVQIEHSWAGGWLMHLQTDAVRVLTFHNLHWVLAERQHQMNQPGSADPDSGRLLRYESALAQSFDLCLTTSESDRALLNSAAPAASISVVPNGVDSRYFDTTAVINGHALSDGHGRISSVAFTGSLFYAPNIDAVQFFASEIFPGVRVAYPDAVFIAAGKNPSASLLALGRDSNVQIAGDVPDTRPYLLGAKVVVVPLRAGSGTRLKILEALSMKKAVVSTTIGCEGLAVEDQVHLLIADTPKAFAAAVVRLLDDESLRISLGEAGRKLVENSYDWREIAEIQESAWADALARKNRRL